MTISRFYKRASFEADDNVLISGPLANVYAQALAKAYGKDEEGNDTSPVGIIDTDAEGKAISMETQAMDVAEADKLVSKLLQVSNRPTKDYTRIYATSPTEVNEEVAKEIISNILAAPKFTQFILVMDSTDLSELGYVDKAVTRTPRDYRNVNVGVEAFVKGVGGKVVYSLEELKETLPKYTKA